MTAPTITVDKPGVYDMPADVYHADPVPGGSLSSSGARKLLPPSCPARFAYDRANPPTPTRAYDLGHAAHLHVLGAGPPLAVVDADDWRTKAARQARDEAHAGGAVPLLAAEWTQVQAMAAALRAHPFASRLLHPDTGPAEQGLFWVDQETGVWCRALLDKVFVPAARPMVVDYKTCRSAAPDDIQRAIASYGYHQQGDWYLTGVRALDLADGEPQFVLVFQEKEPPYLVTVAQPDPTALQIGQRLNREALRLYRECTESGRWPGYSDDVALVSLPAWVENQHKGDIW